MILHNYDGQQLVETDHCLQQKLMPLMCPFRPKFGPDSGFRIFSESFGCGLNGTGQGTFFFFFLLKDISESILLRKFKPSRLE